MVQYEIKIENKKTMQNMECDLYLYNYKGHNNIDDKVIQGSSLKISQPNVWIYDTQRVFTKLNGIEQLLCISI